MSEEKRRILEMLEAGKITPEDATRLLEALGEEPEAPADQSDPKPTGKTDWFSVLESLGEGVEKAVQEAVEAAGPTLQTLGAEVDSAVQEACQAFQESTVAGVVWPQQSPSVRPLPLEENDYQCPVGGPVTDLRIEWVNGPVEVRPWEGEIIRVAEYASRPLQEGERLELLEENGLLRIRWSREKNFRRKMFLQKHLVVELPQNAALGEFRVDNVSGGTYVTGVQGTQIRVSTVSGPLECQALRGENLRVESVSGQVDLAQVSARDLRVSGTSGKVTVNGFGAEHMRAETVSGSLSAWGNGEDLRLSTVSGPLSLQVSQFPRQTKLHTVSGPIEVYLPQGEPGFTAEYSSISGGFTSQFPLTGELGKRKGRAVYLGGGASIRLDTVSGPIKLLNEVKN